LGDGLGVAVELGQSAAIDRFVMPALEAGIQGFFG